MRQRGSALASSTCALHGACVCCNFGLGLFPQCRQQPASLACPVPVRLSVFAPDAVACKMWATTCQCGRQHATRAVLYSRCSDAEKSTPWRRPGAMQTGTALLMLPAALTTSWYHPQCCASLRSPRPPPCGALFCITQSILRLYAPPQQLFPASPFAVRHANAVGTVAALSELRVCRWRAWTGGCTFFKLDGRIHTS